MRRCVYICVFALKHVWLQLPPRTLYILDWIGSYPVIHGTFELSVVLLCDHRRLPVPLMITWWLFACQWLKH